ncbi:MAG: 50S ribosome-binding GTPase, partial [Kiritimatiellae bacterium]|nr:50S ribosome-binding GTPase [Kiritimatiellia bacterium]
MERKESDFEACVRKGYERFGPLARRYYYRFTRPTVTVGGSPCMIFLGNHSSGKSSLINWVLGGAPVQDVGLAPTDDGFTVIAYGEREEDVCGPGALARLPAEFADLGLFGDNFLQRLRVKVRNREPLRRVTLIDTPGMIDSAEQTVGRAYNFEGVVRTLAELCDMVFFLLDPDKPGTTGETVNVFARCLVGVEFKLRVLLNKCDAFSGMYDFARTYGTACWNLARVLRTKDLPKIWTIYSGEAREGGGLDFADFNRHREEFLSVFRNASERRRDNMFSQATADFNGLSIRMCVVNHAARRLAVFRLLHGLFGAATAAAAAVLAYRL